MQQEHIMESALSRLPPTALNQHETTLVSRDTSNDGRLGQGRRTVEPLMTARDQVSLAVEDAIDGGVS